MLTVINYSNALEREVAETPFWTEAQRKQAIALCAPVYLEISVSLWQQLCQAVAALDQLLNSESHRQEALGREELSLNDAPGGHGAFICYDFHWRKNEGLRLIEVNSNAGGLLLNDWLRQHTDRWRGLPSSSVVPVVEQMFKEHWQQTGARQPLRRIVIVDHQPEQQILYPEFLLYAERLRERGFIVEICDIGDLYQYSYATEHADCLIYNRLTDFYLKNVPDWQKLHWVPSPATFAIYADKRNLLDLQQQQSVAPWVLACRGVAEQPMEWWWAQRNDWFFKPSEGYAAKAAYRGARISRKVLQWICEQNNYLAQEYFPATEVDSPGWGRYKVDLRVFSYAGQPLLLCARLYQGQLTNMRTSGGGFAPVYVRNG